MHCTYKLCAWYSLTYDLEVALCQTFLTAPLLGYSRNLKCKFTSLCTERSSAVGYGVNCILLCQYFSIVNCKYCFLKINIILLVLYKNVATFRPFSDPVTVCQHRRYVPLKRTEIREEKEKFTVVTGRTSKVCQNRKNSTRVVAFRADVYVKEREGPRVLCP
jgi:hypothetical protein